MSLLALAAASCSGNTSGGTDVPPGLVDVRYVYADEGGADAASGTIGEDATIGEQPGDAPVALSDAPAVDTSDGGGTSGCTWPAEWSCQDETTRYRCIDGAIVVEECPEAAWCDDALGACLPVCGPGRANCSGVLEDGCNVDTTSDPLHCGDCLTTCGEAACIDSTCVCAAATQKATPTPLDMYIMMDQSTSMDGNTDLGISRWAAVAKAVAAFVKSPDSEGIGVGIQFFPIIKPSGWDSEASSCAIADYAKPEVAIGVLPGNADALIQAMSDHGPTGYTPTYPALAGALQLAGAHAAANPGHSVVVVLATDGEPSDCSPTDIDPIAELSAVASKGAPAVRTFVIGVGDSLDNLNQIASSGDTDAAFLVDQSGDLVKDFLAALEDIQCKALGCTFSIPTPPEGETLDFAKVNVQVTLGANPAVMLGYADSEAACDPTEGGWHYDTPTAPNKILLCPATCDAVTADATPAVDILLGCGRTGLSTH